MKNRILCVAMAAICAMGMISCGNPAQPDIISISQDNVDDYILKIGKYEGLIVSADKEEVTDRLVEEYADHYYEDLAKATPSLADGSGKVQPMTDEAISKLGSDVYGSVSEFMVFVRETVTNFADYEYRHNVADEALELVVSTSEFGDIPESFLNAQVSKIEAEYKEPADLYGLTIEQYLIICATSLEEVTNQYAKKELVLLKIAKEQNITASEDEDLEDAVYEYLYSVTKVK